MAGAEVSVRANGDGATGGDISVVKTCPSELEVDRVWEGILETLELRRAEKMAGLTPRKHSPLTQSEEAILATIFVKVNCTFCFAGAHAAFCRKDMRDAASRQHASFGV
jgi:hypothetical protein